MSLQSPNVVLYDGYGNVIPVQNGVAIPANTSALLFAGSDGTTARNILTDSAGRITIIGSGNFNNASVGSTAAAPPASATYLGGSVTTAAPTYTTGQMNALSLTTTGLLRIDGSSVTQPVSGTITANAGTGNFTVVQATAASLNATVIGTVTSNIGTTNGLALDATLAKLTIAQSAALGTNTQAMIGGSVTTTAPTYITGNINPLSLTTAGALRIDGSGSTQPISGTVTSNQGTAASLANAWSTKITDATNGPVAVKAASTAAVATDPALVVAISPNNTIITSNAAVSATGAAPPASATYIGASVTTAAPTYTTGQMNALSLTTAGLLRIDGVYPINATTPTTDGTFIAAAVTTAAPTYTTGQMSALSLTTSGALRTDASATTQPVSGTVTANAGTGNFTVVQTTAASLNATVVGNTAAGSGAATNLVTVQGNASGTPIPISGTFTTDKSGTGTITSVAGVITSFTLLASNASRILASVYNATNKTLFIAMAATASTAAYTIQVATSSFYELSLSYTGIITAISPAGVTGNVLVTEYT